MALSMMFPYSAFPSRSVISRRHRHHSPYHHSLFAPDFPSTVVPLHASDIEWVHRALDLTASDAVASCQSSYTTTSDNDATVVEVDLPGVPKDGVSVELNGRKLVVTGRRTTKSDNATGVPSHPATDAAMTDTAGTHPTNPDATPNSADAKAAPDTTGPDATAPATVVHDEPDPEAHKAREHDGSTKTADKSADQSADKDCAMADRDVNDNNNDHRSHSVLYKTVLRLGPHVDTESITVPHFRDGVLTLRLPHRKPSEARRIMIQ